MNEHKRIRYNAWLEIICTMILQFLLYHGLACTVLGFFYEQERPEHYQWLFLLAVPMIYLMLVRKFVHKFILFVLLHLPVFFTAVFLGQDFGEKAVVGAATIIMAEFSLYICTYGKGSARECPSMKMSGILLVCYAVLSYFGQETGMKYLYYEILLFIVLHFIWDNLTNMEMMFYMNASASNFPARQMSVVNRIMMAVFLAMVVFAMFLFPRLHLEWIVVPVITGAMQLLAWLLRMIRLPEPAEQIENVVTGPNMSSALQELSQGAETAAVWVILEKIAETVVIIGLSVLVTVGIVWVLYHMYKGFDTGRKEGSDEKEFLLIGVKEKVRTREKLSSVKGAGNKSWNQKIRKEYKRYIRKHREKKETVPKTMTPMELLLWIQKKKLDYEADEEAQRQINRIYEKARYAEKVCEKEEWEELKRIL